MQTSPSTGRRISAGRRHGPRLTAPGLVILQSLLISAALVVELLVRQKVAFFSGALILLVFAGGVLFARPNIAPLAAVVPPLATFVGLLIFLPTIGPSSFSPTRLAIDLSASLANVAPYLLAGALGAWAIALYRRRS